MFPTSYQCRRLLASIALLSILIRVLVPSGYMPASLADGWYLKLCPHGLTDSAVMALLGQGTHHHHHTDQNDHGHSPGHNFHQCELGSGFGVSVVLDSIGLLVALFLLLYVTPRYLYPALNCANTRFYDSRAPPRLLIS